MPFAIGLIESGSVPDELSNCRNRATTWRSPDPLNGLSITGLHERARNARALSVNAPPDMNMNFAA